MEQAASRPLPRRRLGGTGHDVTAPALGGVTYSRLDDTAAARLVHRALDLGTNYIDTAYSYAGSERKTGLVMAYGFLVSRARDALRFVMGLDGVAAAVVGVDDLAQLEQNVAWARAFAPLTAAERDALLLHARETYAARAQEAWFIQR